MALTLTIGIPGKPSKDFLPYVDFHSININDSVEVAADTMSFKLSIYNHAIEVPQAGNEVIFQDGSTKEFAGTLISIERAYGTENLERVYECSCYDYTWLLNGIFVNNEYTTTEIDSLLGGAPRTEVFAGDLVKAILVDLFNNSEGDIHYEFMKNNLTNIETGPALGTIKFDKILVSQVFDNIAQASGMIWWIGFDKQIYFKSSSVVLAGHLVSNILDIDYDLYTYFDFSEKEDIKDIGTQIIIRDIKQESTNFRTDEFLGSQGTKHGSQSNKVFRLISMPFSFVSISSVTKNTGAGDVAQTKFIEIVDGTTEGGEGSSTAVFIHISERYVRFSNANAVANTDVVKITYKYIFERDTDDRDPDCVDELKERTGGSGIRQFIYAQASGLVVKSNEDLTRLQNALISRKCLVLRTGQFTSWVKGWKAGQYFIRKWDSELLVPEGMYVIGVQKRIRIPHDDPNTGVNVVESLITFSNLPHGISH